MPNPYRTGDSWWWSDGVSPNPRGPYPSEREALRGLLRHNAEGKKTLWEHVKEFWHDTRGAR